MQEMEQFKKYGGGTIVENTSFGIKRNVNFMQEITKKHGVNIIAGAGMLTAFTIEFFISFESFCVFQVPVLNFS